MNNKYRNNYCGKINEQLVDSEVRISGFVENIRDHGGVIFVDLRDESGVIQLVSNDDTIFNDLSKSIILPNSS